MEQNDSILDDIKMHEVEAPYFQRLAVTLLDLVFEIGLMVAFYILLPSETMYKLLGTTSYMKYIVTLFIIFFYRFSCIFLFGKTIGMAICGVKYLNNNLQPLKIQ
jgi:uncharacterized RDD family membrane protein YckC